MQNNVHVAKIRSDLHSSAAMHVLPHVAPQFQRRRVQVDPATHIVKHSAAAVMIGVFFEM